MHGTWFCEIRRYAEWKSGEDGWKRILGGADLVKRRYTALEEYPDEEAVALLEAMSRHFRRTVEQVQHDLGEFIAPGLIDFYPALVDPKWRTLDLIEHTEGTIHAVVRTRRPGAQPPKLECERLDPSRLVLRYGSKRRMCHLLKGIADGVARYYGEKISMHETTCMHRGDAACEIVITKT